MKKDFKLGYEIDCLIRAIETETDEKEEKDLRVRLELAEIKAIKMFGSIDSCIKECIYS